MDLEEWKRLSSGERRKVMERWNPYAGEGEHIAQGVASELRDELASDQAVEDVVACVNHGATWVPAVLLREHGGRQFSQEYLGFPLKVLGPPSDTTLERGDA